MRPAEPAAVGFVQNEESGWRVFQAKAAFALCTEREAL
jgi:hypothetical protein